MKKLLLYISIMLILVGCAQLDKAGDYVLKEVSSIDDNPEGHEENRALLDDVDAELIFDDQGEDVEANKSTSKE